MQYGVYETIDVFQHLRDLELSDFKVGTSFYIPTAVEFERSNVKILN